MPYKILIVDDDEDLLRTIHLTMKTWSYDADYASGVSKALMLMKMNNYDIIITDKNMPVKEGNDEGGMHVLKFAKKLLPATEVIIMTGHSTMETALEAMRNGAFDYISKPFQLQELKKIIDKIIEYKSFSNSSTALSLYREIFNEILKLAENKYNPDDKELHALLKSILDKFYNFFIIQKDYDHAFKNINQNLEKLKDNMLRKDLNYEYVLNISRIIDNHLKT
jgi:DNA-binding response OmpR family regulator